MQREIILRAISAERDRQDKKFGTARVDSLPNGTGRDFRATARLHRLICDDETARGTVSFKDILLEEVYEALAESDAVALREELIQVAAVCVKWVEKLDRVDLAESKAGGQ